VHLGLILPNFGEGSTPEGIRRMAEAAARAANTEPLARLLRSDLEESTRGETYTVVLTAGEGHPTTTTPPS
jgi:hypothetical protein